MKLGIGLLTVSVACSVHCAAQSFEEQHAEGLQHNPAGVTLTISIRDGRTTYHLSDRLRLRLTLTSKKQRVYTVETMDGGNAASVSDEVTFQGAEMVNPMRLRPGPFPAVCCDSDRRYATPQPLSVQMIFSFKDLERSLNGSRFWPLTTELKPGEYGMFIQTRRLMRGWPKLADEYSDVSNIVVTSSNILHLKILPDAKRQPTQALKMK